MLNKEIFFNSLGELFKPVSMPQYRGMTAIIDYWNNTGEYDGRKLAYILATVYWETARTMQPIEEYGKGKKHKYGIPDPITGKAYYGRGFVQLTWDYNYKKLGQILGVDLYNKPELALDLGISTAILFEGMFKGLFTGKKLADYFPDNEPANELNVINARKIINGTDKAKEIEMIYNKFLTAIFKAT